VSDRLAIRTSSAISVVEEQCFDHVLVFHGQLRSHDVLLYLLAELFESPAVVELDFKFYLLGARILRIGIGVLARDTLLLKVLILDLYRHEKLDAALVLLLVAWNEGWLLACGVDGSCGLGASSLLATWVTGCNLRGTIVLGALLELDALCGTWLVRYFALFIDVGEVSCRLNICVCKRFLRIGLRNSVWELSLHLRGLG